VAGQVAGPEWLVADVYADGPRRGADAMMPRLWVTLVDGIHNAIYYSTS